MQFRMIIWKQASIAHHFSYRRHVIYQRKAFIPFRIEYESQTPALYSKNIKATT